MSLALLLHYLMLNMFRMLIHPSSGACDLFVELFHGFVLLWFDVCWCHVVVWLWWCGIRMQAEELVFHGWYCSGSMCTEVPQPAYGYHTTTAKPQRNTNTHQTRVIQPMK